MSENDSILKEFLIECTENLDQLDRDLVVLEKDPGNREKLASIFRAIHTIKGTCGFLGLSKLESVTHVGESLLGRLRDGELDLDSERTTALLTMVDAIREMLDSIEKTEKEGDGDYSKLIATLTGLQEGWVNPHADRKPVPRMPGGPAASAGADFLQAVLPAAASRPKLPADAVPSSGRDADSSSPSGTASVVSPYEQLGGRNGVENLINELYRRVRADAELKPLFSKINKTRMESFKKNQAAVLAQILGGPGRLKKPSFHEQHVKLGMKGHAVLHLTVLLSSALETQGVSNSLRKAVLAALAPADMVKETKRAETAAASSQDQPYVLILESESTSRQAEVPSATAQEVRQSQGETAPVPEPANGSELGHSIAESSIRVDVDLLDKLMNLVGELVLARNQILQHSTSEETANAGLTATAQRLNLITSELQEGVMKTRMQPIGNIWAKFPRVVRDLAQSFHKRIRIEMEGRETGLDKTIIEAIKDPLTHLVRNSADHGIESLEERVAANKPVEGRILLRAFHEGGQVNIEIIDDGRGIDPEAIKKKAVRSGQITPDQAARMSEREALHLIFAAGFTTAKAVTNISGRGVGMDVVKTNIEKIGGTLDLQSTLGEGTVVKIRIPLTLAIIPALVVISGEDRYAIPQVSLLELVRVDQGDGEKGIERIKGAPVYRLRGNLLPLVFLSEVLNLRDESGALQGESGLNIVVLQADDQQFGLVVDQVLDTEEIVVKPLGKRLKNLTIYSGATIMGDGAVAPILDVMGLAMNASVISEEREAEIAQAPAREAAEKAALEIGTRQALLVFEVGAQHQMAMPLSQVARLEEVPKTSVERAGDQPVVQYRGEIMPLIHLTEAYGRVATEDDVVNDMLQMVVYTENEKSFGLVVTRILDIVDEIVEIEHDHHLEGLLGSVVIKERVTDMIDLRWIVNRVDQKFFQELETSKVEG